MSKSLLLIIGYCFVNLRTVKALLSTVWVNTFPLKLVVGDRLSFA